MTLPSVPQTNPHLLPSLSQGQEQHKGLPPIWSELESHRRQQLAQCLAQLIRRIQLQTKSVEVNHEQSSFF
jgi:hypothetical protein